MKITYEFSVVLVILLRAPLGWSETVPVRATLDSRIRAAVYNGDQVYRLHGYVGYQIDLQFEPGETFVGLGAGDIDGVSFVSQDNHLFIKPKAAKVATNLTVVTTRRYYQFDYTASAEHPEPGDPDVMYALRFTYAPPTPTSQISPPALGARLDRSEAIRPRNVDYWYCGSAVLKPTAASDDGVHTRLRFGAKAELPAVFVENDDGSESLLNFSMQGGDVIVHRVVRQLMVRRGKLSGRVVNKGFSGSGARLESGTVAPDVERVTEGGLP